MHAAPAAKLKERARTRGKEASRETTHTFPRHFRDVYPAVYFRRRNLHLGGIRARCVRTHPLFFSFFFLAIRHTYVHNTSDGYRRLLHRRKRGVASRLENGERPLAFSRAPTSTTMTSPPSPRSVTLVSPSRTGAM